jgi:hypothetical protein
MISCASSAVWSSVLSHCCTEHGQWHCVVMSGHITTVAISKSGQLGRRCTIATCAHVLRVMVAHVSGVSATCRHALKSREPSRIGRPAKSFFILEVCSTQRAVGHVAASESSWAGKWGLMSWDTWQRRSPLEQGVMIWSHGTCGSARAQPEQGGKMQNRGTRDSVGTLLSMKAWSGAARHVAASEPSRAGRQDPALSGMWQYVLLISNSSLYA